MNRGLRFWLMLAVTVVLAVVGVDVVRNGITAHKYALDILTRGAGEILITRTNCDQWVQMTPDFRAALANLLTSPTKVATVLLGDEPSPTGDGKASSRLILTNELGHGLGVRLCLEHGNTSGPQYEVLSYWRITQRTGSTNESQPIRSETDSTPSATASRP